ncbi:anti-sigma factor [Cyanobium gracile UHCC 0139]|uniref:Regulator of SigK n=1 Tax=Cyanobium gracile UHCC 0139 TaxID=3110308 RepID=A0ABU5RQK3_9CYAN|nr:anti-sigma factor [Cyanobium gracile]MEA5390038.1 anti-sigma factor [Cyanobium gracile UHCC 0139]
MTPADQPSLDELLAGHVLGDLEEAEQQRFRAALADDPSLQAHIEELQVTLNLLPLAIPAGVAPPPRLRDALMQKVDGRRRQATEARKPWIRDGTQVGMAAMACAVLVMGLQVVQLRGELAKQKGSAPAMAGLTADMKASRTLLLHGSGGQQGLSGQVVVNAGMGYNLLLIKGLPPAPPNHVYRLWAEVGGQSVGCVRFVPNADGIVSMPIPSEPSSHAKSLSINIESLRADDAGPDGPQVLTSV